MKNYHVISGIAQYFTPFCLHKDDVIHLPGHARSHLRRIHFVIASSCLRTDMPTIFLDNDCFFNMQSAYSTEEMVLLCMLKNLNIFCRTQSQLLRRASASQVLRGCLYRNK